MVAGLLCSVHRRRQKDKDEKCPNTTQYTAPGSEVLYLQASILVVAWPISTSKTFASTSELCTYFKITVRDLSAYAKIISRYSEENYHHLVFWSIQSKASTAFTF